MIPSPPETSMPLSFGPGLLLAAPAPAHTRSCSSSNSSPPTSSSSSDPKSPRCGSSGSSRSSSRITTPPGLANLKYACISAPAPYPVTREHSHSPGSPCSLTNPTATSPWPPPKKTTPPPRTLPPRDRYQHQRQPQPQQQQQQPRIQFQQPLTVPPGGPRSSSNGAGGDHDNSSSSSNKHKQTLHRSASAVLARLDAAGIDAASPAQVHELKALSAHQFERRVELLQARQERARAAKEAADDALAASSKQARLPSYVLSLQRHLSFSSSIGGGGGGGGDSQRGRLVRRAGLADWSAPRHSSRCFAVTVSLVCAVFVVAVVLAAVSATVLS